MVRVTGLDGATAMKDSARLISRLRRFSVS
jgi:hypothetical protein